MPITFGRLRHGYLGTTPKEMPSLGLRLVGDNRRELQPDPRNFLFHGFQGRFVRSVERFGNNLSLHTGRQPLHLLQKQKLDGRTDGLGRQQPDDQPLPDVHAKVSRFRQLEKLIDKCPGLQITFQQRLQILPKGRRVSLAADRNELLSIFMNLANYLRIKRALGHHIDALLHHWVLRRLAKHPKDLSNQRRILRARSHPNSSGDRHR